MSDLLTTCIAKGLIQKIPEGYLITESSFVNPKQRDTTKTVFTIICDYCRARGTKAPSWERTAIGLIAVHYNLNMPNDHYQNINYQLRKHCTSLPKSVSLPYFIKAFGLTKRYLEALAKKAEYESTPMTFDF